ncbi:MAG TPA: phosphodiester glycosidase family protein [Alphaproteobacteria bacterium]
MAAGWVAWSAACGGARADQPLHRLDSNGHPLDILLKAADDAVVSYVEIDPRRHRLDVALSAAPGDGSTLREFLTTAGAAVAFTGGYLRSFAPPAPTGYLLVDGAELNPIVRDDPVVNAVLCFGRDPSVLTAVRLVPARKFRRRETDEDCVQAGPLLIDRGEAVYDLRRKDRLNRLAGEFERAFLGIDRRNSIILGVSSRTSLQRIRDLLLASREAGGLAMRSAVILTGATTAGMEVGGGLGYSFGTTSTPLPNAILVDAPPRPAQ